MKIILTSVMVDNQDKALKFYTAILGFVVKHNIPMGGEHRWLTVVDKDQPNGVEILLEPLGFEPAKIYQQQLFDAGIPATAFGVDDIEAEYKRLGALGVKFKSQPTSMGPVTVASFEDTCGNLIQMVQGG